jgi:hypothetical protein
MDRGRDVDYQDWLTDTKENTLLKVRRHTDIKENTLPKVRRLTNTKENTLLKVGRTTAI